MPQLGLAFFVSGFAALLCQIVWQRMLGLIAGSETVSAALVVGAFLTGLGLGAVLGAWIADRLGRRAAIIGFAIAETGVALFALASRPFLYDWLAMDVARSIDHQPTLFALCFAGLVLPTTLMGASLPLLSRVVATSLETVAGRIALLYGLNTIGAGLGALLGGWFVLGVLGFEGALMFAAALELLAAALALTLLPGIARTEAAVAAPAQQAGAAPADLGSLPLWCALAFASGFVIVALEILWVRVIGQFGQYHAYLFATVLGVFLLADGAGMAAGARMVARLRDPRAAFFLSQAAGFVLAAVLLLGLWFAMPLLPSIHNDPTWVDASRLRGVLLAVTAGVTLLLVGPPAFLIGMTFAFIQRAVQRDLAQVGARVGWVQLANISGNAAGSLGTGLVSLHVLGTAGTVSLLAAVTLGLVMLWLLHARALPRAGWAMAAAAAVLLAAFPGNDAFWRRMHVVQAGQPVAWAEDRSGVAFFRDDSGLAERRRALTWRREASPFFIQGFAQGTIPFLQVHLFLGALGPLLHARPEQVLVIGVGSGGTPWAAGVNPATARIRGVELVAPVLTALEQVGRMQPGSPMQRLFTDPRWQLEYGDGRRALVHDPQRYDVIEADAILPEGSQSGLVYSAEFLREVRARLQPGGLYVQWAPSVRAVETFVAEFPHAMLLLPAAVLIGSDRPIPYDRAALLARMAEPAVAAHLGAGQTGCCDWASMVRDVPLVWTPQTPRGPAPLTDLFPRDEFYLNNSINFAATLAGRAR